MVQRQWFLIIPAVAVLLFGGRTLIVPTETRSSDGRLVNSSTLELEKELGYHLYAPTWMPNDGSASKTGARIGARRVMQSFCTRGDETICILAQQLRSEEVDRYHEGLFEARADASADINGSKGHLMTGTSGERRLFWNLEDRALIISSTQLTDDELVRVARAVR